VIQITSPLLLRAYAARLLASEERYAMEWKPVSLAYTACAILIVASAP
jgi:hypothetical protein